MRRSAITSVTIVLLIGTSWAIAQAPSKKTPPESSPSAQAPARVKMPPLPSPGYPPPRPVDHTRAVYEFAAQHPEVLKYVPCYCGCEAEGHPHNESCFVKSRDPQGNVTAWDIHGYG